MKLRIAIEMEKKKKNYKEKVCGNFSDTTL